MKKPILPLCAAVLALSACTVAPDDQYAAAPPPPAYPDYSTPGAPGGNVYNGPVNTYYGPVTINNAPAPDYGSYPSGNAAPAYPGNYSGYDYGAAYGGYGQGYGYGYGYPTAPYPYTVGAGMTPPVYAPARLDPWNGYNWGWNNGY